MAHWFEGCTKCNAGLCQAFDHKVDEEKKPATIAAEELRQDAINHIVETMSINKEVAEKIVPTANQLRNSWQYYKGLRQNKSDAQIAQTPATFNETNENIEWAKWSWNPVTGCKHGCKYCYAKDIATRFYPPEIGFKPHFYPTRLNAPENSKIPKGREAEPGIKNVFVCSMADLFGSWVQQDWIDQTLKAVEANQQWQFLFLTKNPSRLTTIKWPTNAWVGTTVDVQSRVEAAEDAFSKIKAKVKFLSCEPLLEPLKFSSLSMFDWVIIGGRSGSSGASAFQPKWEWVESLMYYARRDKCKIYFKPNLEVRPKEYPVS